MRAAFAVNRELILLYWSVGRDILARQQAEGWETKVIDRLAHDLQNEFPGVEGFSPRSLKYMRSFALGPSYGSAGPAQGPPLRVWYLRASLEYSWRRNILVHQIAGRLHERQGKALTNFSLTLTPGDSDLAEQILKDPYNFDFLTLTSSAKERELKRGLLLHLRDLLLELGRGFAFVGSQVPLIVDETFYIDLLFYHVRLHSYFVIELKIEAFKPEYAGKLNFYLSAVDGLPRTERDDPTIGLLLLCESRKGAVVEYAFKDTEKPIGVATYRVTRELPEPLKAEVPSIEDLEGVVEKLRSEFDAVRDAQERSNGEG